MQRIAGPCLKSLLALGSSILFAGSLFGQHQQQKDPHQVIVLSATVDLSDSSSGQTSGAGAGKVSETLTIEGTNFPADALVMLNGQALTILSNSSSTIVAQLPGAVAAAPGSYALTLETPRHVILAHFVVTIGAAAPPPPTAYGATFSGGVNVGTGTSATDIADITLPAGYYMIHAVVNGTPATPDTLNCGLYDDANATVPMVSGQTDLQSATGLPLLGMLQVSSAINGESQSSTTDTVHLFCGVANSPEGGITATLVAVPVAVGSFTQFSNTIGSGGGVVPGGWNRITNKQTM